MFSLKLTGNGKIYEIRIRGTHKVFEEKAKELLITNLKFTEAEVRGKPP